MSKFSVRLTPEEDDMLDRLQSRWKVDRSKALRLALRRANRPALPREGWFTARGQQFQIRLKGQNDEQS